MSVEKLGRESSYIFRSDVVNLISIHYIYIQTHVLGRDIWIELKIGCMHGLQ